MRLKSKEWLDEPTGIAMPDDACGPDYKYDSLSRIVLESKKDMRTRGAQSPDEWDAVALTFAEPVGPESSYFGRELKYPRPIGW